MRPDPGGMRLFWPTAYASEDADRFLGPLVGALGEIAPVTRTQIPQEFPGIVVFEASGDAGPPRRVAIDYIDLPVLNQPCHETVSLYFKLQYARDGYEVPGVVSGGYVAGKPKVYREFCRLRRLGSKPASCDVYGRFGLEFAEKTRLRALEILRERDDFTFLGGPELVLHMQSLREAAQAKVCIDLPGRGPFCHRLVEYLAMGCCVVGPRHGAVMPVELEDRVHMVYCRDDLEDLGDLCSHYARHRDEREEIGANAARYFDAHLHPRRLAEHYVRELQTALGEAD
jgi:hypothetical protein